MSNPRALTMVVAPICYNPQYSDIHNEHQQKLKEVKKVEQEHKVVANTLKHIHEVSSSLSRELNKKKHELNWLKNVKERHLRDARMKQERLKKQNQQLEQLRMLKNQEREGSIYQLEVAKQTLHSNKKRKASQVRNTLNKLKKEQSLKNKLFPYEEVMHSRVVEEHEEGKKKINSFYRKKYKEMLKGIREEIEVDTFKVRKKKQGLKMMSSEYQQCKSKVDRKNQKLQHLQRKIEEMRSQGKNNRYDSLPNKERRLITDLTSQDILCKIS